MPRKRKTNQIGRHLVYTVDELCAVVGCGKPIIKTLVQDLGLPIHGTRPTLIYGGDAKRAFKALERKAPTGPHQALCLRCQAMRTPVFARTEVVDHGPTTRWIKGPCAICGTGLNRITRIVDVPRIMAAIENANKNGVLHCTREDAPIENPRSAPPLSFAARPLENLRQRRAFARHLAGGRGLASGTVKIHIAALEEFEAFTGYRDFKAFRRRDAEDFRQHLRDAISPKSGRSLSLATIKQRTAFVHAFFVWLSQQDGYRRTITQDKYEQFNLTRREAALARVRDERPVPTLGEVEEVLGCLPHETEIERRDRALFAFIALTGLRAQAVIDLRLKHVNLERATVRQDPREVRTKFAKDMTTSFFPIGGSVQGIVEDYVRWLRTEKRFAPDDPLFPKANKLRMGKFAFRYEGLSRLPWTCTNPLREAVNNAFEQAGCLPYGPHVFRHMLAQEGNRVATTHEEFKAWSQNLGHSDVRTTQTSYAMLAGPQQTEIIDRMRAKSAKERGKKVA